MNIPMGSSVFLVNNAVCEFFIQNGLIRAMLNTIHPVLFRLKVPERALKEDRLEMSGRRNGWPGFFRRRMAGR